MYNFGNIFVSWRKGSGYNRYIIGVIKLKRSGATFSYIEHEVKEAIKAGFTTYTEFPDIETTYTENIVDIFSQRLIKTERGDIKTFLDFWGIPLDKSDDKIYLMAHTQAWVPTDNFELLADFNPVKDLCFVTDLAGLSYSKISSDKVVVGDILTFKKTPMQPDRHAVQIYKGDLLLGYVKKVHNSIFYKNHNSKLRLKVSAVEKNGYIKRLFIKIEG